MHDIFISYSTTDKTTADAVCKRLEDDRFKCWYAPRDIEGGEDWQASIVRAIKEAKVFILVFTKNSNISNHVKTEVATAFNSGCKIIPFRLDDVDLSEALYYALAAIQWLDATKMSENDRVEALCQRVNYILRGEFPPPPPPPQPPTPPQPTGSKKKLAVILCCVIAVLAVVLSVYYINSNAPAEDEVKREDPKKIDELQDIPKPITTFYLYNIYNYLDSTYSYTFYRDYMISNDYDKIVMESETGDKLNILKTDTLTPIISDIKNVFDSSSSYIELVYSENSDTIGFIEDFRKLWAYSKSENKWITETPIDLGLGEDEFHLFSVNTSDGNIIVFIADESIITKAIFFTTGLFDSLETIDLKPFELTSELYYINKNDGVRNEYYLFTNRRDEFILFDFSNMECKKISPKDLSVNYLPYALDFDNGFSPNGQYWVEKKKNGDSIQVNIYDLLNNNKKCFSKTFPSNYNLSFKSDNEILYFDFDKDSVFSYDLVERTNSVILSKDFFNSNDDFTSFPISFWYDKKMSDAYIFLTCYIDEITEEYLYNLTVTDLDGNVIIKSEDIPRVLDTYQLRITDSALVFLTWDDTETSFYCAEYVKDGKTGKYEFK